MRQRTFGRSKVWSAGSHPKPVHPQAVAAMAAQGIDISARSSKHLDRFRSTRLDRVITLCDRVREVCPDFPSAAGVAHWSVADPAGAPAERAATAFRAVADELGDRIDFLLAELVER